MQVMRTLSSKRHARPLPVSWLLSFCLSSVAAELGGRTRNTRQYLQQECKYDQAYEVFVGESDHIGARNAGERPQILPHKKLGRQPSEPSNHLVRRSQTHRLPPRLLLYTLVRDSILNNTCLMQWLPTCWATGRVYVSAMVTVVAAATVDVESTLVVTVTVTVEHMLTGPDGVTSPPYPLLYTECNIFAGCE